MADYSGWGHYSEFETKFLTNRPLRCTVQVEASDEQTTDEHEEDATMTAKDLQTIKSGDLIRYKAGYMNAGSTATFIRLLPPPTSPGLTQQVEFEDCGQVKTLKHTAFTRVR